MDNITLILLRLITCKHRKEFNYYKGFHNKIGAKIIYNDITVT